jgi:chromosome segregation ATPase
MNDIDALREEIRRERERLNNLEQRVNRMEPVSDRILRFIQGDAELLEKGAAARIADFSAFMSEMKAIDWVKVAEFLKDYNDLKKRVLWLVGIMGGGIGLALTAMKYFNDIQKALHP